MKAIIGKIIICGLLAAAVQMPVMAEDAADYVDEPILISTYHNEAASAENAAAPDAEYTVTADGETVDLGLNKVYTTDNGTVMVPVRAIAEKLGYTVTWDDASKSVYIDNGVINSTLFIGENLYSTVSSTAIGMSAPTSLESAPKLINSTTYVPVKFFELLYYTVDIGGNAIYISSENGLEGNNENVQIPNPFVEYKTIEEAKTALSFSAAVPSEVPSGYELKSITVMSGKMLQLEYSDGDNTITFRTAEGNEDISGDYNEYENVETENVGDTEITLKSTDDLYYNAVWNDDSSYALNVENGIDRDTIIKIAESVDYPADMEYNNTVGIESSNAASETESVNSVSDALSSDSTIDTSGAASAEASSENDYAAADTGT